MAKQEKTEINTKKIVDWLNSEDGKETLKEAMELADETVKELKKAREIDFNTLHTPFGPADGGRLWPHQRV